MSKFAPHVGMGARVIHPVAAYSAYGKSFDLMPDVNVTVRRIDVPVVRLSPCVDCGRKHETFVLVEWPSSRPEMMKHNNPERAAVYPCNLMEWSTS